MLTNDLKKGDLVVLANGWKAHIEDNKKGTVRMATVYGFETEMGSIYAHDIEWFLPKGLALRIKLTHTPAQLKLKKAVESLY